MDSQKTRPSKGGFFNARNFVIDQAFHMGLNSQSIQLAQSLIPTSQIA